MGQKLSVVKEIADETLHIVVPSMLLQPLIENSIKHGLEPRIGGGTVTLRSRIPKMADLLLEVEDDGVGMAPERNVASRSAVWCGRAPASACATCANGWRCSTETSQP